MLTTALIKSGSRVATTCEDILERNALKGDIMRDSSLSESDIIDDICVVEKIEVLVGKIVEIEEIGKNHRFRKLYANKLNF